MACSHIKKFYFLRHLTNVFYTWSAHTGDPEGGDDEHLVQGMKIGDHFFLHQLLNTWLIVVYTWSAKEMIEGEPPGLGSENIPRNRT